MSYSIWLSNASNVEKYLSRNNNFRRIDNQMMIGDEVFDMPIQLNINGHEDYRFNLDEIDYLTSRFKNFDSLKKYILNTPLYKGEECDKNSRLILVSNRNIIGKYVPIYNNPFLHKCSEIIINKRNGQENEYLDITEDFKKYVDKLLKYLISPSTSKSFLDNENIPPHVLEILNIYKEDYEKHKFGKMHGDRELFLKYCTNYKTLRNFILWEENLLKERNKKRLETRRYNEETKNEYGIGIIEHNKELDRVPTEKELELEELSHDGKYDMDEIYAIYDNDDFHERELQMIGNDSGKVKGKYR